MRRSMILGACAVCVLLGGWSAGHAREYWSWGHIKQAFAEMGFYDVKAGSRAVDAPTLANPTYPYRTTPHQVIEKLRLAYEARSLFHYVDCLSDTLTFLMNPADLYSHPAWPASWTYGYELALHDDMFGPVGQVVAVYLALQEVRAPEELPSPVPGGSSSWLLRYNYDLFVKTDGLWDYIADGGAEFTLSVDPSGTGPGGEPLWEIASWADVEEIHSAVQESSWGRIKALYR